MTELLIDVGNRRCKYACVENHHIRLCGAFVASEADEMSEVARKCTSAMPDISYMISVASSTTNRAIADAVVQYLGHGPILLDPKMPICGMRSDYRAEQLGTDRVVVMIAAWQRLKQACIVIDCGTAITVDLIDDDGLHKGGMILPSDELMRSTLARRTAQLDYYEERNDSFAILATDTEVAITSGCRLVSLASIFEAVRMIRERYSRDIPVLATGGSASILESTTAYRDMNIDLIKNLTVIPTLNFEGMIALIGAHK